MKKHLLISSRTNQTKEIISFKFSLVMQRAKLTSRRMNEGFLTGSWAPWFALHGCGKSNDQSTLGIYLAYTSQSHVMEKSQGRN